MGSDEERFSERFGFAENEIKEIEIINDAPKELRGIVLDIAYESGMSAGSMRNLICYIFRIREDLGNWSEPNIHYEIIDILDSCKWYEVYDLIEHVYQHLLNRANISAYSSNDYKYGYFQGEINKYFIKKGIGWKLVDGKLEVRSNELFEHALKESKELLQQSGRSTANNELNEAIKDLSKRPSADITGSIQHCLAALECLARDITGNKNSTLGEILKKCPNLVPKPLDMAIEKIWGYSSEFGRHLREGRLPTFEEATLVVGLVSVLTNYLISKNDVQ